MPHVPGSPRSGRRRPATTPEAREAELIGYAQDLAEQQMRAGTASAQVISHYLKLGSTRERLEQERLRQENLMTEAKIAQIASGRDVQELYANALAAMRTYGGHEPLDRDDYED